jgi:hypothetical protein
MLNFTDVLTVLWNRTATFCLCGTGTEMHFGSGTGFGSVSNIKCNTKVKTVKKFKNERPTFTETMLFLKENCTIFFKAVLNMVWIRFQIWIRNRKQNFSTVGTEIKFKHFASTTLRVSYHQYFAFIYFY